MKIKTSLTLLMLSASLAFAQSLTYAPQQPRTGDTLHLIYTFGGIQKVDSVKFKVYQYTTSVTPVLFECWVKVRDQKAEYFYPISKTTTLLLFNFVFSETEVDNNVGEGYWVHCYDQNGVLPLSEANQAVVLAGWRIWIYRLQKDYLRALPLFESAFRRDSTLKKEQYLYYYLNTLKELSPERFKSELNRLGQNKDLTVRDYSYLIPELLSLRDTTTAKRFHDRLLTTFPENSNVIDKASFNLRKSFFEAKEMAQKKALYDTYLEQYAFVKSPDGLNRIASHKAIFLSQLFPFYESTHHVNQWQAEVEKIPLPSLRESTYYLTSLLLKSKKRYEEALQYADEAIKIGRMLMESPRDTTREPLDLSDNEIRYYRKVTLSAEIHHRGQILLSMGQLAAAVKVFEEAVDYSNYTKTEQNEDLFLGLVKLKRLDEAHQLGLLCKQKSVSTPAIDWEMTQGLFAAQQEQRLGDYAKKENFLLSHKLIDEPSKYFSLKSLDGKVVSLDSLAGKTIVLDFWATWCGPCLAAFPGMYNLMKKYEGDSTVAFLFVNTGENDANPRKRVEELINKKKYPFRVLLDADHTMAKDYKVNSLPTKVIIDKNGRIRYRQVGFNPQENERELGAVIELLQ